MNLMIVLAYLVQNIDKIPFVNCPVLVIHVSTLLIKLVYIQLVSFEGELKWNVCDFVIRSVVVDVNIMVKLAIAMTDEWIALTSTFSQFYLY